MIEIKISGVNLTDVLVNALENERVVSFGESWSNVIIHGMNVSLVHGHTLAGQTGSVINRNVMKIWMLLPKFVQDKKKLLRSAESKCWEKNMATSANDGMNQICETLFLLFPTFQALNTIRTFYNKNIRSHWWQFSFDEMSIFLPWVISSVEYFQTSNVNEKHASTQDVTSVIWCERNTRTNRYELMGWNRNNRCQRHSHIQRREQRIGRWRASDDAKYKLEDIAEELVIRTPCEHSLASWTCEQLLLDVSCIPCLFHRGSLSSK